MAEASQRCEALARGTSVGLQGRVGRSRKKGEVVLEENYGSGSASSTQGDDGERRALGPGDCVALRWVGETGYPGAIVCEMDVALGRPLVLCVPTGDGLTVDGVLRACGPHGAARVDKIASRTTYTRVVKALAALAANAPLSNRGLAAPHPDLRKALVSPGFRAVRVARTGAQAVDRASVGLNASQVAAVRAAVDGRLTLVQGPPGTGKTRVACAVLSAWAMDAQQQGGGGCGGGRTKILATSDSNVAVDNLLEGLAKTEAALGGRLRLARLGQPESVRPELLRYCADARGGGNGLGGGDSARASYDAKVALVRDADVICATCVGAGADLLERFQFDKVLIDEAAQATEPVCVVPICRRATQLVLVGDQCQLPPTVLDAKQGEHVVPLFTRLLDVVKPHLLDTQYRMHPVLSAFSNDACYAGRLCDGVHPRDRAIEDRLLRAVGAAVGAETLSSALPVAVAHVAGKERDDGASKSNDDEANAVARAVGAFLAGGLDARDVAVLAPYAAQVKQIKRALRNAGIDPLQRGLEVSSVDAIQGREKEVIVLSTVRANADGKLGFVADWRRLNVSLTRARRCALLFGDVKTLVKDPEIWRPFLAWALAAGCANRAAVDALSKDRLLYDAPKVRTHAIRRTPSLGADYLPAPVLDATKHLLHADAAANKADSVFDAEYAAQQDARDANLASGPRPPAPFFASRLARERGSKQERPPPPQAKIASAASLVSLASQQDSVKDAWDDSDDDDDVAEAGGPGATKDGGWGDDDDDDATATTAL